MSDKEYTTFVIALMMQFPSMAKKEFVARAAITIVDMK